LLSRYAERISKELAREAAQLDMAPPGNKAAKQASTHVKSLLGLLTGCCRADLSRQDSAGQAGKRRSPDPRNNTA